MTHRIGTQLIRDQFHSCIMCGNRVILFLSVPAVMNEYGRLGRTGHIVLVYAFAVLVLPFFCLLAQLLGFHVMLSEYLS